MNFQPSIRPVGFNLGGWISQSNLSDEHVNTFIKEDDFKTIAQWGFNSVRIPLDAPWLFREGGLGPRIPEKWELLRTYLGWARNAGLLAILDLHQVPWHSFARPELENLWRNEEDLNSFCQKWEEMAYDLRHSGEGLWLEILNEPTARETQDWNKVASRTLAAIRKADHQRVVVIESTFWGSIDRLPDLYHAVQDDRLVYSFHFYSPMFVTHQSAPWWKDGLPYTEKVEYPGTLPKVEEYLAQPIPQATRFFLEREGKRHWDRDSLRDWFKPLLPLIKEGAPLYCGEFGVYEQVSRSSRLAWTRDTVEIFKELGIGWSYWNYKWLDFGVWPQAPGGGTAPLDGEMLEILKKGI
jgi:endoglucanase